MFASFGINETCACARALPKLGDADSGALRDALGTLVVRGARRQGGRQGGGRRRQEGGRRGQVIVL